MTQPPLPSSKLVLVLSGILLSGCAAGPKSADPSSPPSGDTQAAPHAAPVWNVLSEPNGTGQPVTVEDLQPFVTDEESWFVLEGKDAGTLIERRRGPTDKHSAQWQADLGDGDVHFLVRTDDGGVGMVAVEAHADKATSFFGRPLGLAPPRLFAGETFTSEAPMKVTDIADESKVTQRGKATRTLEHLGSVRVATSAGPRTVQALRMVFRADLDVAKAVTTTTLYVVPGEGVVASKSREEVHAMLIFNRKVEQSLVRIESGRE